MQFSFLVLDFTSNYRIDYLITSTVQKMSFFGRIFSTAKWMLDSGQAPNSKVAFTKRCKSIFFFFDGNGMIRYCSWCFKFLVYFFIFYYERWTPMSPVLHIVDCSLFLKTKRFHICNYSKIWFFSFFFFVFFFFTVKIICQNTYSNQEQPCI